MNLKTGYQQALDYLYSFIDYETMHQPRSSVHYDLRRMEELLSHLGNPHLKARTIHIAGTKGKGSTAAMIASVLTACGYKTGLYTSPHLIDLRERIRIDGKLIPRTEMARLTERLKTEATKVNDRAAYGKLTTFELLTTLGFMFFAEQKVDFQVVEVGLGGRLDATNVVNPEVCVITTIGLDHTDILGHTLTQIAGEKAGIIKLGVPVVSACQGLEATQVITHACHEKKASLIRVGQDIRYFDMGTTISRQLIDIHGRLADYKIKLPLLGQYQQANAAAAIGALEVLVEKGSHISQDKIASGLGKVHWPGRFQVIRSHPLVVLDGAHNPAAACELKKAIYLYPGIAKRRSILVIGTSSDKDYAGMAQELARIFDAVVVTRSNHPRSLDISILLGEFQKHGIEVQTNPSVAGALAQAIGMAGENGFVCATGSLFIVGEALTWARRRGY